MTNPRRDAMATLDEAIASATALRDRLNESIGKMATTRYDLMRAVLADAPTGYDDETLNMPGLSERVS